jgi:hypothetical protein
MLQLPSVTILESLAVRGGHILDEVAGRAKITAISRRVRLDNPSARAAFAVVQWRGVDLALDNVPCTLCSTLTVGFCDACHFRNEPGNPAPYPVCTICDGERRLCRICAAAGWTKEASEQEFIRQYPRAVMGQTMVIYGTHNQEGFKRYDKPLEINFPTQTTIRGLSGAACKVYVGSPGQE